MDISVKFEPRLKNGAEVFAIICEMETAFAVQNTALTVLKDRVVRMMLEAEHIANGSASGEVVASPRKETRVREWGLRLRSGDPQAGRSMLQRQRALKAVKKMRAAGFPNLQAARAAKTRKAAERRAREEPQ